MHCCHDVIGNSHKVAARERVIMKTAFTCSIALSGFLLLALASPGRADEFDRLSYFTFSGAVQVPGATLAAGTYTFKLANPNSGRNVGIVTSRNDRIVYSQFLLTPDLRRSLMKDDDSLILFHETPAGIPPAVRAWFYPGQETGYVLKYSRKQMQSF